MNRVLPVRQTPMPAASAAERPRIILDISRTLGRALAPVPSGIDRVELAYIRCLLDLVPDRLVFSVVLPFTWRLMPVETVVPLIDAIEERWQRGGRHSTEPWAELLSLTARAWHRFPRWLRPMPKRPSVYVHVSHVWLEKPKVLRSMLHHERARMLCLVHDTIPIDMPEYVRPGEAETHQLRMRTIGELADVIVSNSESTTRSVARFVRKRGEYPHVVTAPLGVDQPARVGQPPLRLRNTPYFVVIGTIEPRKNHLLLLHLWRQFAARLGRDAPRLIVIGRRGWENENVIDLIERSEGVRMLVEEHNRLSDAEVNALVGGARALLFPSFAEGYGLPLAEALALGTPAIASDIPALREVGGAAPEYLDALDAPAWGRAILDYAAPDSPRRAAQVKRLADWHRPLWEDHVSTALAAADALGTAAGTF
jgi:glycosyltransferase involved in cell wall biosynthesis